MVDLNAAAMFGGLASWFISGFCGFDLGFRDSFDVMMQDNVYGQHIAVDILPAEIRNHIDLVCDQDGSVENPSKALALSFHGGTGTGKTFVSLFIEKSLFNGYASQHKFSGAQFTDSTRLEQYKRDISGIIRKSLQNSPYSLFVFVDTHLFTPGTLDILAGYLDYGMDNVHGVDYSKAIYILQSNLCDKDVNFQLMQHLEAGRARESLSLETVLGGLNECLQKDPYYGQSQLYKKNILYHVPFLPLGRNEIRGCIRSYLNMLRETGIKQKKWLDLVWEDEVLFFIGDQWKMFGAFATSGCKQLDDLVRTRVMSKLNRMNKKVACKSKKPWNFLSKRKCWKLQEDVVTLRVAKEKEVEEIEVTSGPPRMSETTETTETMRTTRSTSTTEGVRLEEETHYDL